MSGHSDLGIFNNLGASSIFPGKKADTASAACPSQPGNLEMISMTFAAVICFVLFVLETIRTGTMRVIHNTVKTEETQILRIKFVLVLSYLNQTHLSTVLHCTVLPVLTNTSKSTFPSDN